jgi:hypothetical protein
MRFLWAAVSILLTMFGTATVLHNLGRPSEAVGVGLGAGVLLAAAFAGLEYVRGGRSVSR